MNDPKSVFSGFYKALMTGDIETALTFLDPDFKIHEPAGLPYGGEYQGHQGFLQLLQGINEYWESMDPPEEGQEPEMYTDGDMLFVIGTLSGKVRATGKQFAVQVMERHQIRDGKIIESWPFYYCTHGVREAGMA